MGVNDCEDFRLKQKFTSSKTTTSITLYFVKNPNLLLVLDALSCDFKEKSHWRMYKVYERGKNLFATNVEGEN